MTEYPLPDRKPARPFFSSGPCAKPPGYSPDKLATESLGRSHRAKIGKARLQAFPRATMCVTCKQRAERR